MDIAKTIAQRRKFFRLTQTDLAQIADVGISTVKDLERGTGNPSIKTLQKICTALGLEILLEIKCIQL